MWIGGRDVFFLFFFWLCGFGEDFWIGKRDGNGNESLSLGSMNL